jgi:hypothetical protein
VDDPANRAANQQRERTYARASTHATHTAAAGPNTADLTNSASTTANTTNATATPTSDSHAPTAARNF